MASVRIELLTKDNYDSWKIQVEALLIRHDFWEYVSGEKSKPKDESSLLTWKVADRKARSELILALDPSVVRHVKRLETSREVWLKLESLFASRGPAKKATLMKRLMLQRMSEDQKVTEHLDSFFEAVDKLEEMDIVIHDDLLAIMLLHSLPVSYENFRCAIESRDELPTPQQLRVKIMEEDSSRYNTKVNDKIEGAMFINQKKKSGFDTSFKYKCFKCHKMGHKASDCKAKHKKSENKSTSEVNCVQSFINMQEQHEALSVNYVSDDCLAVEAKHRQEWLFDSGCSSHMCNDEGRFDEVLPTNETLKLATDSQTITQGKGTVKILACNDYMTRKIQFEDTLLVPDLRTNLISISKLTDRGCIVTFKRDVAYAIKDGEVKLTADRKSNLYYLREPDALASVISGSIDVDLYRWHERMGHLNARDLLKVLRKSGIEAAKSDTKLQDCDVCAMGKMVSLPFVKPSQRCNEKLHIIYSDVVGPMRVQSNGGNKYFVIFIDDCTRWCEVFMLKNKSDVLSKFKIFKSQIENVIGCKIKYLHTDNGTEFLNKNFTDFLEENGIGRRLTTPYTPQSNGIAERMNRTLLEKARCMLLSSGLPPSFWAEAVATACYIRNRCPTSSLNWEIPYEKLFNKTVNIGYFRTFGAKVHVLDKEPGKDKFAARSSPGIFVGYPAQSSGYRVWLSEKKKIVISRDVKFQERNQTDSNVPIESPMELQREQESCMKSKSIEVEIPDRRPVSVQIRDERIEIPVDHLPNVQMSDVQCTESTVTTGTSDDSDQVERSITLKRGPGRPRIERGNVGRPRKIYNMVEIRETENSDSESQVEEYPDCANFAGAIETSLREALGSDEKTQWKEAILSEIKSLVNSDTWKIVKKPIDRDVVGCRYVLTTKLNVDLTEKKKARLVAKGYSQQYGLDYFKTFAPVARIATVRLLVALAVELNMEIDQLDINTAYLNGDLDETIYMKIPELLKESLDKLKNNRGDIGKKASKMLEDIKAGGDTCLLKKSLYGLKQAGRQWNVKLDKQLREMGLKPTVSEPCLYHKCDKDGADLFVVVYVDDILVASRERIAIDKFKQELARKFELKDFGPATFCLGIDIKKNGNEYHLSQKRYIQTILKRFGMENCNPVKTPMEVGNISMSDDVKKVQSYPYRELIGALMFLSVATRPDIADATAKMAQFAECPQEVHWIAAKRILRYLKGTLNQVLRYKPTGQCIQGYADADWGNCVIDRRSYTGYVFILGGASISWASQKQRIVATSTCEAEFVSLAEAMKEAVYLNVLMKELQLHQLSKVNMHADNLAAICLAEDPGVYHAKSKHIDIRHFFIRDVLREHKSYITLRHLATENMLADIFTKPLPRVRHELLKNALGLVSSVELCDKA